MRIGFSQPEIIQTAKNLGLPTDGFVQRRVARAYDLVASNKVMEVDDGIFRVRSQYEPQKSYIVNLNHGHPNCDCHDGQRTINCKHRIASLLYLRQEIDALTITDDTKNSCNQRGRWIVTDYQDKVVYHIYRDIKGNLICPCGRKPDCKHRKAIKEYISKNKIKNGCGTERAQEIQEQLNRHLNRLKDSGAEFDWQVAYEKCIKAAGTKASVDITINELVKASKLRPDNPSHYNRTEWLTIYHACNYEDDDGDDSPSSTFYQSVMGSDGWKEKLGECKNTALNATRFNWIKIDLMRENALRKASPKYWMDKDFDLLKRACALDTSLFNREIGEHWVIQKEGNFNAWDYSRRYRFWVVTKDMQELRERCFYCGQTKGQVAQLRDDLIFWERYQIKTVICSDCLKATTKSDMTKRFRELYNAGEGAVNTDGLPKLSEVYQQSIEKAIVGGDAK